MQNQFRSFCELALLSAALAVLVLPDVARAQSGSAGGSIGNDEKSLSGSRSAPPAAEPSKPARRSKPADDAPRASPRSGGGGGNFDGAWVLTSRSASCAGSTDAVVVTSGKMVGQYGTGQVSSSGAVSGTGAAGGLSWTMSGRFSGRGGSGTFQRSDGCVGTWTGAKQ